MLKMGQRVRKVRGSQNVGCTGVVDMLDPSPDDGYRIRIRVDQTIAGVQSGRSVKAQKGDSIWIIEDEWEEIQYDGNEPGRWADGWCWWSPRKGYKGPAL